LIVSRYRDELRRDGNPETAMTRTMQRTAPTILASSAIVVASMCVLLLADFNATRELGPILGLGIIVMGICAVTLLPALLVAIGQRAFWPTRVVVGEVSSRSPLWSRVSGLVRRRPLLLASVSTLVLLAGALGNIGGRGYLDVTDEYRVPTESVLGQQVIRERYDPPGRIAPLDIVSSSADGLPVKDALAEARGVAASNTDSQSRDGKLISSQVLLNVDPFSTKAMDLVPSLRRVAKQTGSTALIGGVAAENYDNRAALQRDTKLIVPIVLLLILLVLIALLRSVVAPLYVMGSVILSFAFALGVSSLVFTHVFGQPDSDPNETIFAFIFLIALGVDDNIFLMTRIREEYRRGVGARDAVISGLEQTGGVITAAGLILAGTFASLMALQLEALFQVGFIVALGLLVDAFVVRTLLVPAVAILLGDRSWWPGRAPHAP
jgi:RND superfamily putative drug exporter